jgi:dolichol-phosphate mannosyltransferase
VLKAVVVIPTYNERHNISKLVREIDRTVPGLDVLVVDDSSPDGTGQEVSELAAQLRRKSPC